MTSTPPELTKPKLSILDAVCIIVGIVVGPGIFEASSSIARALPSIDSLIAIWIIGGILSWSGMACYAELASRYPKNGGEYVWLNVAYGKRVADLFLWADVAIIRPGAIASMAFPAAHYCSALVSSIPLTETSLAAVIIAIFSLLNVAGFYVGKATQNALTILTIVAMLVIIGIGISAPPVSPLEQTLSANDTTQSYGLALILVLFAYGGWNEIANVAGDIRGGARKLYQASVISLAMTTLLYVAINYAFAHLLGFATYSSSPIPVIDGLRRLFPGSAVSVVYATIFLSCLGTIQGMVFTGARLYYYLPIWESEVASDLTRRQLAISYLAQACIALLITILSSSFMNAVVYTTAVVWIFFLLKGLSATLMRWQTPTAAPFSMPLYPVPVIAFCGSCLYLSYSAIVYSPRGSLTSLCVVALGLIVPPMMRAFKTSRL